MKTAYELFADRIRAAHSARVSGEESVNAYRDAYRSTKQYVFSEHWDHATLSAIANDVIRHAALIDTCSHPYEYVMSEYGRAAAFALHVL